MESFQGQLNHHRGILADRVQHDRILGFRDHFTNGVNAFGFQLFGEIRNFSRKAYVQLEETAQA